MFHFFRKMKVATYPILLVSAYLKRTQKKDKSAFEEEKGT